MITSTTNKQIKLIQKLQKSNKERKQQGLFVIEGIRMFKEIPVEYLDKVFVTELFYEKNKGYSPLFSFSFSEKSVKYGVVSICILLLMNMDKSFIGLISCILRGETIIHLMSFCFIRFIISLLFGYMFNPKRL